MIIKVTQMKKKLFIVVKLHESLKILIWYAMHLQSRQLTKCFKLLFKKLTIYIPITNASNETSYFITVIALN